MNPLLILVFLFSSVSCDCDVEHTNYNETANEVAHRLLAIVQKALDTNNIVCLPLAFGENFMGTFCNGDLMFHKDLDRIAHQVGLIVNNTKLTIEDAEFYYGGLKFNVVEPDGHKTAVYARNREGFTIEVIHYSGMRCPSNKTRK